VLFPPPIVDALHRRSGGVPRLINRVCDRALNLAYERKAEVVDQEILETALIEIGSVTLSPTWDSIIFAEAPQASSLPAPAPAPAPTPAPAPAPTAALVGHIVDTTPPLEYEEDFTKQIDHWVAKDLAPPPPPRRALTHRDVLLADEAPVKPRPQRRAAPSTASKREASARVVKTDWPRDLRSETYMQRLWRKWSKRVAIALAVFVALNVVVVGASQLLETLTPPVLPATPEAPALAVPEVARPEAPPIIARVASDSVAATSIADSGEYLVAVGLFGSRDRADQVVDALTKAGLPAMERPFQLRLQQVQQIVIGPFFSRSEAVAALRRLQALGGYEDARVIDSARATTAQ